MKSRCQAVFRLLTAILILMNCEACSFLRKTVSRPVGAGFGAIVYESGVIHKGHRRELHYWDRRGKRTLIWRYLSHQILYSRDDLALFHGYLTTGPEDYGGPRRRHIERLFAVEGPGPAVDITDDVVLMWADEIGTNWSAALKTGYVDSLMKTNGTFQIWVGIRFGPVGTMELSRDQLLQMIRQAKVKGKPMKDPGYGTPYFKRDWEAELKGQK